MNINNINNLEKVKKIIQKENPDIQANKAAETGTAAINDKIEISQNAKDYNQIKKAATKVISDINSEVPVETLNKLKTDINIGKYRIASRDIAEAMIGTGINKE